MPPEMAELVDRRLYKLSSRNLRCGVWNAKEKGFTGIRTKWGNQFLATEYHYDTGAPFGTARATEDTGLDLPEGIGQHEYEPSACSTCGARVEWLGPPAPAPWGHLDTDLNELHQVVPISHRNNSFFRWLEWQESLLFVNA